MRYLLAGSDYFGSMSDDPIKEAFVCLTSSLTIFSALRKCHSFLIPLLALHTHAYLITLSARIRSVWGNVIPRVWAVFRLRASSNVVGCSTGRSVGLVPVRRRST